MFILNYVFLRTIVFAEVDNILFWGEESGVEKKWRWEAFCLTMCRYFLEHCWALIKYEMTFLLSIFFYIIFTLFIYIFLLLIMRRLVSNIFGDLKQIKFQTWRKWITSTIEIHGKIIVIIIKNICLDYGLLRFDIVTKSHWNYYLETFCYLSRKMSSIFLSIHFWFYFFNQFLLVNSWYVHSV